MSNKILQFEPFKIAKKWDDEYAKFLGYTEKYFGAKTNPEQMVKRLYFAMRYLSGVEVEQIYLSHCADVDDDFHRGKPWGGTVLLHLCSGRYGACQFGRTDAVGRTSRDAGG